MTVDYKGIAIVIGAIAAATGPIVTAYLQIQASKKLETNKQEAIAARAAQTNTIIASAITPALNTPVPDKTDVNVA